MNLNTRGNEYDLEIYSVELFTSTSFYKSRGDDLNL